MENIELSLRMKENGALVFIPGSVAGKAAKHIPSGNRAGFMKSMYEAVRYLVLRRFGLPDCHNEAGCHAEPTDPAKKQAA